MKYDESVLLAHAAALEGKAESVMVQHGVAGFLQGAGIAYGLSILDSVASLSFLPHLRHPPAAPPEHSDIGLAIASLVALIALTLRGVAKGRAAAFNLRLRAQLVLCQVQTEKNTRGAMAALVTGLRRPAG